MPRRKNNRRRTKEKKEVDVHVIDPQAPSGRGMHIKSLTAVYADSHFDETHAVEVESDSGNESPLVDITSAPCREHVLSYQCPESIKAWTFYQACILERYHWFLEKRKRSVADDYSYRMSHAYLHLSGASLSVKIQELHKLMARDLEEIDAEEKLANATFRDNIAGLKAGQSITALPSVDPHVTLSQIADYVSRYDSAESGRPNSSAVGRMVDSGVNLKASICSEDSGLMLLDRSTTRGLGLSSLSEIWKPENDELLERSFSNSGSGFYQTPSPSLPCENILPYHNVMDPEHYSPQMPMPLPIQAPTVMEPVHRPPVAPIQPPIHAPATVTEPVHHLPPDPIALPPHVPSVTDDDSAIQTVIYSRDIHPSVLNPVRAADSNVTSAGHPLLGLSALTDLSSEYKDTSMSTVTDRDSISVNGGGSVASSAIASPQLSTETDSVKSTQQVSVVYEGMEKKSAKKKKKKTINKALLSDPVVKFIDSKTVDNKDKKLLESVSFGWSKGSINDQEITADDPGDVSGSLTTVVVKPASFAAALKSAPTTPRAVIKDSDSQTTVVDTDGVFSTKRPTRKYSESSSLNKTSICWTFQKMNKCPWGVDCIFAHGKKELQPLPAWFKPSTQPASVHPHKAEDSKHPEPCSNHYCHFRRQFFLKKTAMCKLWLSGRCAETRINCQYAHGQSDRKPLPKQEICKMFMNGKCKLKSTECVYAHSKTELRLPDKSKFKKVRSTSESSPTPTRRLRTISETTTGSNDSWSSVVRQERVRTISGTSLYSNEGANDLSACDLEEFDWLAWNAQYEVPEDEQLDDSLNYDECAICSFDFTEENPRFALECEHESFHQKCISQWVLEKDHSCPICRHPADVKDERFTMALETN